MTTALQQAAHDIGAKGSEPTEEERRAFEAWMRGHCWAVIGDWDGKQYKHDCEDGEFVHGGAMGTRRLWAAWRDRGAVARVLAEQAQETRTALEQYDLDQSADYQKGWKDGRIKGYEVGHRYATEARKAQPVEPATGERAELIAGIKHEVAEFAHNKTLETLLLDAIEMLEADAREIEGLECDYTDQVLRAIAVEEKLAQQVAVPAGEWRKLALQFDGQRMQALGHLRAMTLNPHAHMAEAMKFLAAPPAEAQQVAVHDGLIDALREASEFISAVHHGAVPQTRYPLPDELDGFAAILTAQGAKLVTKPDSRPTDWSAA